MPSRLAFPRLHMRSGPPIAWLSFLAIFLAGVSTIFLFPRPATAGSLIKLEIPVVSSAPTTRPLLSDYSIHGDGSVTLRICFNWSCASRQHLTFTSTDMANVAQRMQICSGDGLYDRLQRLRIGIWQMEVLAEKYQPLLANDEAVNDRDQSLKGRTDCIDNATNTTTYLHVLHDLGLLPGWSLGGPRIRHRFSELVHWTAVVIDRQDAHSWSVDSWLRPNGHLPFVMPLKDWKADEFPWDPPFIAWNPVPRYSNQFCAV